MTAPSHTHVASPARRPLVWALGIISSALGWVAGKTHAGSTATARTSWGMTHRVERTVVLDVYSVSGAYHTFDGTWCDGLLEVNPNLVSGLTPFLLDEQAFLTLRSASSLEEVYDHLPPPLQFMLVVNDMVTPPTPPDQEPQIEVPDDLSALDDEEDDGPDDHVHVSLNNPGVCLMDAFYHRDGTLCQADVAVYGVEAEMVIAEEGTYYFPEMSLLTRLMAAETPGEAMLVTEGVED